MNGVLLAIDPGTERSGWMEFYDGKPHNWGWWPNAELLDMIDSVPRRARDLVIEDMAHFGPNIRVGRDVFETCKWMGRFEQANRGATYLARTKIKTHLTGLASTKDKDVRIALIDLYGGEREAIGGIKCATCNGKGWTGRGRPACTDCHHVGIPETRKDYIGCGYEVHPGILHGIKSHEWSALAIGRTYLDMQDKSQEVAM
jgi:hypothetical protein